MDASIIDKLTSFTDKQLRKDRLDTFVELTKSICPVCKKNIDARVLVKNNKLYMEKQCSEHGYFKGLILSDAEWYFNSLKFNKSGSIPLHFNTKSKNTFNCPDDCGICPQHQQHTCIAILEITNNCNLSCYQCFAESCNDEDSFISLDEVKNRMENLIKCEGKAEVIQISGGEPTLHPEIIPIIKILKSYKVQSIMISTNGIRIANDKKFVKQLSEIQNIKPFIYLQFDGFKDEFYKKYRGKSLLDIKLKAIENLAEYNFKIALVATIIENENDDQIGKIIDFGIKHKNIRTINFQPVFHEGRIKGEFDPMNRITITDIFDLIETQTKGILKKSDFMPVPCPFPSCSAITYIFYDEGKITPITRLVDAEDYLDFFKNRTLGYLNESIFESLKSPSPPTAAVLK